MFYNTTIYDPEVATEQASVSTKCMCALDGDNGYCGSVLGTETYADGMAALRPVLQNSRCHTLDRSNIRAQKDFCGIGPGIVWDEAVTRMFNINYWPYVNANENVKECVEKNFADSLTNLKKAEGAV